MESTIENGLWQIYGTRYLSEPLDYIRFHGITYWDRIIARVIVFCRNTHKRKWDIRAYEVHHSIAQAINIDNTFSLSGEILGNNQFLIGAGTIEKARKAGRLFLETNQAKSIYELIGSNPSILLQEFNLESPRKRAKSSDDLDDEEI